EVDDRLHLAVRNEHALQPGGPPCLDRQVEHVAASQQLLGTGLVEDDPRVDARADGEGDPRRDVGFDQAGDDVGGGALGRDQEVNAHGTGELGDATDQLL